MINKSTTNKATIYTVVHIDWSRQTVSWWPDSLQSTVSFSSHLLDLFSHLKRRPQYWHRFIVLVHRLKQNAGSTARVSSCLDQNETSNGNYAIKQQSVFQYPPEVNSPVTWSKLEVKCILCFVWNNSTWIRWSPMVFYAPLTTRDSINCGDVRDISVKGETKILHLFHLDNNSLHYEFKLIYNMQVFYLRDICKLVCCTSYH